MNAINGRKVECTKKTTTIPIVVDNDVERERKKLVFDSDT